MKKLLFFCITLLVCSAAQAQTLPYSKYFNFSEEDFKANNFKYDDYTNIWSLNKVSGLNTTLNILAIIADASEEIRPSKKDYSIIVQMGKENQKSYVKAIFYDDEVYHKILTFMSDNGQNLLETTSGKLIKTQAFYGDYNIELEMEQHLISRTSARTADRKTVKNVDESYNKYEFTIFSEVEPWSQKIEKKAAKQAKRDAKGKKKQSISDLM